MMGGQGGEGRGLGRQGRDRDRGNLGQRPQGQLGEDTTWLEHLIHHMYNSHWSGTDIDELITDTSSVVHAH